MKKIIVGMLCMSVLLFASTASGQMSKASVTAKKVLPVTTKSSVARDLANKGTIYFQNIDMEQAYGYFADAVKADPNFTYAQVFMSFLTRGEVSKKFAQQAINSAKNKSEGEKLFASLADKNNKAEDYRTIWTKLHTIYPESDLVAGFYVFNLATPEERFAAAQDYVKRFPNNGVIYNMLGYYYMNDKKDMENAKKSFEKYIAMCPKYANPYDSMGEFYLNNGDTENAEKYYTKALEINPFFISSVNAIDKINADKKAKEKAPE
jgi:Tfp pilus assembly protein PilF